MRPKHHPLVLLLFFIASVPLCPADVDASDASLALSIGNAIYTQDNYLDRGDLELLQQSEFNKDYYYNEVNIEPALTFSLGERVEGNISADFWFEVHFDDGEKNEVDGELTSAYLGFANQRVQCNLGLQPVQVGNGRLVTDEAPAVDLIIASGDARLSLTAARLMDKSPLAGFSLEYTPGFLENISLFGFWYQDEDDVFGQTLPEIYQVLLNPSSEGDLYWVGATADMFVGRALLTLVGAYQFGELTVSGGNRRFEANVSAFFGDIALEGNLSSTWSVGAFFMMASGDDRPGDGDLNALVTIQPNNPRGDIFFDPDFLDYDDEERFTLGGSAFGGVMAPGLTMHYAPTEALRFDALAAAYYAHEELDDGSQWYGWELDLGFELTFADDYTLFVRASRFWHGDYFDALLETSNDPASQLVAGIGAEF